MSESPRIRLTAEELLEHSSWVQKLARQLLANRESAEDAVQETWLAALERPPRTRESLGGWLRTVIRHTAQRFEKRDSARRRREHATSRAEAVPSAADLLERAQGQRLVAAIVLDLPEPYRSTLLLRYFEGLTLADIARRSGTPEGTVRAHHQRALREVRVRLVARGESDPEAVRSTKAFLSGSAAFTHTGDAAKAAIGSIVMTTKAKIACAVLVAAALVGVSTWWPGGGAGGPEEAAARPASPRPAETAAVPENPERVTPAPPAPAVANKFSRIRVLDEKGSAIAQAIVIAADRPRASLSDTGYQVIGLTDAEGSFLCDFSKLASALTLLSAHHPAFVAAVEPRPADGADLTFVMRAGEALFIECSALGRPVPGVVIRLSRSTLAARQPEEYAPVPEGILALPGSAGRHNVFAAASDESGRAVVTGLPRGKYGIEVECINRVANLPSGTIEVPRTGPMVIELVDLWVWALDVDTTAPDFLAWKHPGRPGLGFSSRYLHLVRKRLEREWPGRFVDLIAFPYPGGAAPPDLRLEVLHASGVSDNLIRAVKLSEFVRPQPEAPLKPTGEPTGSSLVTIKVVDPDGEPAADFRDYWVQQVGFSPFAKGQWISIFDREKSTNRYREGRYEVHPAGSTAAADFDPVPFRAGDQPELEVVVKLKRRLRPLKLEVSNPPFAQSVPAIITVKLKDGTRTWFTAALEGNLPWLPVGELMEVEVSSFGCLKRVLQVTLEPGEGAKTIEVALEDEPDER
jgi:RNA polymerase sigma factor (sigma-70 family)